MYEATNFSVARLELPSKPQPGNVRRCALPATTRPHIRGTWAGVLVQINPTDVGSGLPSYSLLAPRAKLQLLSQLLEAVSVSRL